MSPKAHATDGPHLEGTDVRGTAWEFAGDSLETHVLSLLNRPAKERVVPCLTERGGGGEVGAGELFLAGLSACTVNMIERLAKDQRIALQG